MRVFRQLVWGTGGSPGQAVRVEIIGNTIHGGVRSKTISFPTGASDTTLADEKQDWKPDFCHDGTVKSIEPFPSAMWPKNEIGSWIERARQ